MSNGQYVEWGFDIIARDQLGLWDFLNPYEAQQDINGNPIPALTNPTQLFADIYSGNDMLVGGAAGDIFSGRNGQDTITGAGGLDVLNGDAGADTFIYRTGDSVSGEQIFGGTEIDKISAVGTSAIAGALLQSYAVNISGLLVNGVEEVWVNGTEVILNAPQLSNFGLAVGFNVIVGSATANIAETLSVLGAGGHDFTLLQFRNWGNEDTVGLFGSSASETIIGTVFDDAILGYAGSDILRGGQGSDNFIINTTDGAQADTLNGGTFAGTIDQVQINGAGTAELRSSTFSGIEKLQLLTNTANLTVAQANQLTQLAGTVGRSGADTLNVFVTSGSVLRLDDLTITNWYPGITLRGTLVFADTINVLGAGQAAGANGVGATIYGSSQADNVQGTNGRDIVYGGNGTDFIYGNLGADALDGGAGNDQINGGAGADTMTGGADNDIYTVDDAADRTVEALGGGSDLVYAHVTHTLAANVEYLILSGGSIAINGTGNALANGLTGNAGINRLIGGGGNDLLNGGLGNDVLTGGLDMDRFRFDSILSTTPNVDLITDFSVADDTILLENATGRFSALTTLGTLSVAAFFKGAAAHDADDRIIYNAATGNLFYDADGNGAGAQIQFAKLGANLLLTNADFQVI